MEFFDILTAQDQTAARRRQQEQNSARLAYSMHKMGSSGVGNIRRAEPILFSVAFLEEPLFTQGATVVKRPAELTDPVGSAGVWQWHRNPKGHYVGAYIYLAVSVGDSYYEAAGQDIQMQHHLMFQGMGFKDLGQAVATEAQLLAPRTVGFGV